MKTIADLLASLNVVRAAEGKKALTSWKGSRAKLEELCGLVPVIKVPAVVAEGAYDNGRQAEHATGVKGRDEKKRQAIKKSNPKAFSTIEDVGLLKHIAEKQKKASTGEFIALADIARTMGIEPKVARAKARRHDEIAKLSKGDAWQFLPADVAKVKKFLKGE